MSALAAALRGDVAGWAGLPPLGEPELRAQVPARWAWDPAPTPRGARSFRVLRGTRDEAPHSVEAWFAGEQAATVEFRPPDGVDAPALLEATGEPELVTDSNHFEPGGYVQEHVHPARGLALAVARPFPDEQGQTGPPWIVYVQLFAPTDVQTYVSAIGRSGTALRPLPR